MATYSENEGSSTSPPMAQRDIGIDAGRLVMAFFVVVLHALPRATTEHTIAGMVTRCAVPFFLITSGFFLRLPNRITGALVARPFRRLFPIYLFWLIVYYSVAYSTGASALKLGFRDLLSGGTAYHLWFLPALGVAMVFVPAAVVLLGARLTGWVCVAAAVGAMALSTYHDVLHLPGLPKRGGLLIAPLFVFIGYRLAALEAAPKAPFAVALTLGGLALLVAEEFWISWHLGIPLIDHDFTVGTVAYGTGMFLFARTLPEHWLVSRLAPLGAMALGVYVSHPLFLWWLQGASVQDAHPRALHAPVAFACALVMTISLRQVPVLRRVMG